MIRASVLALAALLGCAHEAGPRATARAYLDALAAGDVARAHALSTHAVRTSTPAAALAGLPPAERYHDEGATWTLSLAGDRRLTLVREEDGAWYVDDDALHARGAEDPRGAAVAFLDAALAGDVGRARPFLPEGDALRFADDQVLRAHLEAQRGRLERARSALGDAARRAAVVDGERAQIPYDGRRAVRLVREQGRWRVLDVE